MWVLRAFDKETEELVSEHPLNNVIVEDLRRIWSRPATDPMVVSFPVQPEMIDDLKRYVDAAFDFERFDYFLDYDAD